MLNQKMNAALELLASGTMKDKEIAEAVHVSAKTIWHWKHNNKEFQDEFNKLVATRLQYASSNALRKMQSLLNSRNDMVAFNAAKDLLDRAGFSRSEKLNITNEVVNPFAEMSTEDLKKLISNE